MIEFETALRESVARAQDALQRDHSHAQHEIRVYAEAMRDLARQVAPVSIAAWEEFGA